MTLLGAPAAAGISGYTYSGDCVEATIFVPFDAEAVREEAPDLASFTMAGEDSGQVFGVIGQGRCSGVVLDGTAADDLAFSEVAVSIDSPDGTMGSHAYIIWSLVDLPELHARSCGIGACFPLVRDQTFELEPIGPGASSFEASAGWPHSPYSMSATIHDVPVAGVGDHQVNVWKSGSHGRIRSLFKITKEVDTGGPGLVRAEPGSPLARMLGATEVTVQVFIRRFHFEASTALVR